MDHPGTICRPCPGTTPGSYGAGGFSQMETDYPNNAQHATLFLFHQIICDRKIIAVDYLVKGFVSQTVFNLV